MEVVSPGQGVNGRPSSSSTSTTIDLGIVVRHLVDLLDITLGASTEELENKGSILSEAKKQDTIQRCTRFASESQVALYVHKSLGTGDRQNGAANGHVPAGKVFRQ